MKKLDSKAYQEVQTWIHRNARPLDMAVWDYFFEDGSQEAVIAALNWYQNDDGGFGNALEADSWNPDSSPYTTMIAIELLREIGFTDIEHPMIEGIFRFLESGAHSSQDGWFFNIPTNNNYAHAPWWSYGTLPAQGIGITAALCGFILRYADKNTKLYEKALSYADRVIAKLQSAEIGGIDIYGFCVLCGDLEAEGHFDRAQVLKLTEALVNTAIERNPSKWAEYTPRPSEFIHSPDSPFYQGNEETVSAELDYLIETRKSGSVWDITWNWFDLYAKYPKEFALSENWWKAVKAIEKIRFLKNFGRLD